VGAALKAAVRPVHQLWVGFRSLLIGMWVTLTEFLKRPATVPYPRATMPIPERYRGHIELVLDPETGQSRCVACKLCEKACPSNCIVVEGIKRPGDKKKTPTVFTLDFTLCSLCGACVEVCPTSALRFSRRYNLASTRREDFHIDLLKRLQEQAARPPTRS
jgi:NADH-quinone oxidoreductase subunit I